MASYSRRQSMVEKSKFFESSTIGKFKVVFLGESSVGKTSLIKRFLHDSFDCVYRATIGLDFMTKKVQREDRRNVKFQIWDTAGQERFRSLIPSYIHKSSVAVIVYDITNLDTFHQADRWITELRNNSSCQTWPIIILVGNKLDQNERRQVSEEEGKFKAENLDVMFIETSAKTGYNVKQMFVRLADALPPSGFSDSTYNHKPVVVNKNLNSSSVVLKSSKSDPQVSKETEKRRKFCPC